MKKIKLTDFQITSFVTTLNPYNTQTIKGGSMETAVLPVCNPSNTCHTEAIQCTYNTDEPGCNPQGGSVERVCAGTVYANCPRSGEQAPTVGCTVIC